MLYKNTECPVCKRLFEEGDDIVYCPDCGTPHHRECYNLIGHCVNKGLHKSNYSFYEEHAEKKNESAPIQPNSAENEDDNARGAFFPPIPGMGIDFTQNPYDSSSETINGEKSGDVAAAVRSNVARFMQTFARQEKTGKKTGWNWGAFFFGHYYLFFRKMYRQAITLFCVNLTLSSVLSLLVMKLAPITNDAINELIKASSTANNPDEVVNQFYAIAQTADFDKFKTLYICFAAVALVIRILVSLFADYMYKTDITAMIKKVNEQIDSGAAFNTPTLSPAEEEAFNLSQEQLRRLYLSRRGGISVWAPCLAYIASYLVSMLTGF